MMFPRKPESGHFEIDPDLAAKLDISQSSDDEDGEPRHRGPRRGTANERQQNQVGLKVFRLSGVMCSARNSEVKSKEELEEKIRLLLQTLPEAPPSPPKQSGTKASTAIIMSIKYSSR